MIAIYNYDDYLKRKNPLDFEKCRHIHDLMLKEMGHDSYSAELYEELVTKATEYANIRAMWCLMDVDSRWSQDDSRTSKHDVLIGKVNQLARYLRLNGKDAKWREILGDESQLPTVKTMGL